MVFATGHWGGYGNIQSRPGRYSPDDYPVLGQPAEMDAQAVNREFVPLLRPLVNIPK